MATDTIRRGPASRQQAPRRTDPGNRLVAPRRTEPPYVLPEREMLEVWLEYHRMTLLLKCEGLDDAGRKARPIPTSKL